MRGIDKGRLALSTLVTGALIFLIKGAAMSQSMAEMARALQEHSLTLPMGSGGMLGGAVISLLIGFGLMFFYVAARSRFGPGWKTAAGVAVVFFLTSYVPELIGLSMIDLYPDDLLWEWGLLGLVEMIVATLAGAWLYREAGNAKSRP